MMETGGNGTMIGMPSRLPYLLFGAALGGIFGILYAPRPGIETRKTWRAWLEGMRKRGRLVFREWEDRFPRKEQVTAALKAGRNAYVKTGNHHTKAHAAV